jgi:hypothetical protein
MSTTHECNVDHFFPFNKVTLPIDLYLPFDLIFLLISVELLNLKVIRFTIYKKSVNEYKILRIKCSIFLIPDLVNGTTQVKKRYVQAVI